MKDKPIRNGLQNTTQSLDEGPHKSDLRSSFPLRRTAVLLRKWIRCPTRCLSSQRQSDVILWNDPKSLITADRKSFRVGFEHCFKRLISERRFVMTFSEIACRSLVELCPDSFATLLPSRGLQNRKTARVVRNSCTRHETCWEAILSGSLLEA